MSKIQNSLILHKAMCKLNGQNVLKDVPTMRRERKPRRKELIPRNQPEREFRHLAIDYLRKHGCKIYRIENSISHYKGIADLLIFNSNLKKMHWLELKSHTGQLSKYQKEFKYLCFVCGISHIVAREIEDLKIIADTK